MLFFFASLDLKRKRASHTKELHDLDISKGGEGGENRYDTLYFSSTSRAPHLTVCVCPLPSPRRHEEERGEHALRRKQTTTGRRGQRGRR